MNQYKKNIKNLININENMEKVIPQQAHVSVSKQDFLLFKNIEKQASKLSVLVVNSSAK